MNLDSVFSWEREMLKSEKALIPRMLVNLFILYHKEYQQGFSCNTVNGISAALPELWWKISHEHNNVPRKTPALCNNYIEYCVPYKGMLVFLRTFLFALYPVRYGVISEGGFHWLRAFVAWQFDCVKTNTHNQPANGPLRSYY